MSESKKITPSVGANSSACRRSPANPAGAQVIPTEVGRGHEGDGSRPVEKESPAPRGGEFLGAVFLGVRVARCGVVRWTSHPSPLASPLLAAHRESVRELRRADVRRITGPIGDLPDPELDRFAASLSYPDGFTIPADDFSAYFPPEEIFHPSCLASLASAPLVLDHPSMGRAVDAPDARIIGRCANPRVCRSARFVLCDLYVSDAEAHHAMTSGELADFSCGLVSRSERGKRRVPGIGSFDEIKRNILIDHVALVDIGACGDTRLPSPDERAFFDDENEDGEDGSDD